jgi:multiple sugar transport system ATP-binding protein
MAKLGIRNLFKRFLHVEVLKGINIEIEHGEFLILVGPSGCGKSTLLNIIAGLDSASEGEIFIGDRNVIDVSPKDRDIAMVFQSYALYPSMTVRENIEFAMKMRKVQQAERDEVVSRVAKILQMENLLERRPSQLSGGQRQRVAMGRAIARNPAVFLFDEPLSNLDAKLRVEMRAEIKALHQRLGSTIVYVTHDQVEAMTLGDKIAVMRDGRVEQFGSPEEIYDRPANVYVAGFIGAPSMNLVPTTLGQRGDRLGCEIHAANGVCWVDLAAANKSLAVGTTVMLGIRPEHFKISTEIAPQVFSMNVDLLEPTGADTYAYGEIQGVRCAVRIPPKFMRSPGATLNVSLDTAQLSVFDAASGSRIEMNPSNSRN